MASLNLNLMSPVHSASLPSENARDYHNDMTRVNRYPDTNVTSLNQLINMVRQTNKHVRRALIAYTVSSLYSEFANVKPGS
jgi:hypothetical protein